MGSRLKEEAKHRNVRLTLPAIPLGVIYLLLNATWHLPGAYCLICAITFVPILPFELAARRLNGGGRLAAPTFGRLSLWHFVAIYIGCSCWAVAIIGTLIPKASQAHGYAIDLVNVTPAPGTTLSAGTSVEFLVRVKYSLWIASNGRIVLVFEDGNNHRADSGPQVTQNVDAPGGEVTLSWWGREAMAQLVT